MGYALGLAQLGGKHPHAKPWKGEGPGVLEIVEDFRGDTYRAVYIVVLLGIPQPKVSALKNYRLDQFSVERLMEFLTALDQDVEIMIRPRRAAGMGRISILAVQ